MEQPGEAPRLRATRAVNASPRPRPVPSPGIPEHDDADATGPVDAVRSGPSAPIAIDDARSAAARTQRRSTDWRSFVAAHWMETGSLALMAGGIILVVLGWWGAAHSERFIDQIPFLISGGVLGLGLIVAAAIVGGTALTERSIRELRRDLQVAIRLSGGAPGSLSAPEGAAAAAVLLVPGGRSYHLPGCPIPEGKEGVREVDLADAVAAGQRACRLCGPD